MAVPRPDRATAAKLAALPGVTSMTDVTGFALLGHLLEMCEGSGVAARVTYARLPILAPPGAPRKALG